MRLLYSGRSLCDVLGGDLRAPRTTITLTGGVPDRWQRPTGRIDRRMLAARAFSPTTRPRVFVCGPTTFVETVASTLVDLGHDPSSVRLERFG